MRLYEVYCDNVVMYAGSMAEVRELRKSIAERFDVKKSEVLHREIDFKTDKQSVITFLNKHYV